VKPDAGRTGSPAGQRHRRGGFHDLIFMVARALAKLALIPAPAGSRRRLAPDRTVGKRTWVEFLAGQI
jgi:hypothetical protein